MLRCITFCLVALLVVGCGGPSTSSTSGTSTTSSGTSAPPPPPLASNASGDQLGHEEDANDARPSLDHVLRLWREGNQEQAALAFRSITDWNTLATSPNSVFAVSEQNFMAESRARQAELTEQLIQRNQTLRQLARYLIDAAKKETDVAKARDMLKKIEACGTWLQAPSTKLVQQVGKGLSMTAAKELEQLPTE